MNISNIFNYESPNQFENFVDLTQSLHSQIDVLMQSPIPSKQILETNDFFIFFQKLLEEPFNTQMFQFIMKIILALPDELTEKYVKFLLSVVPEPFRFKFMTVLPVCNSLFVELCSYLFNEKYFAIAFFKLFSNFNKLDQSIRNAIHDNLVSGFNNHFIDQFYTDIFQGVLSELSAIDFLIDVIAIVVSDFNYSLDISFNKIFIKYFSKLNCFPPSFFHFAHQHVSNFVFTNIQYWNSLLKFPKEMFNIFNILPRDQLDHLWSDFLQKLIQLEKTQTNVTLII